MKILSKYKNTLKIRVEQLDDLWHLYHVLKPGDVVESRTTRVIKQGEDEGERKSVRLKINLQKIGFQAFSGDMRLSGMIVEAPEEIPKGHHTLIVKTGTELKITKLWKNWELDRLREAQKTQLQIGLVVMDTKEALIGITSAYGIKTLGNIRSFLPRKGETGFEAAERTYFGEIAATIPDTEKVIVGGPGFSKDNFSNFLKEKHPEIFSKCTFTSTSTATETGFREIVANVLDKVLREARLTLENQVVERFVTEIQKSGLVAYGLEEVEKCAESGAVEELLVSEKLLMEKRLGVDESLDELMEKVREMRGEVRIISQHTEAGQKIHGFGGIGALLRFRV